MQQVAYGAVGLDWVSKVVICEDFVRILTADTFSLNESFCLKVSNDSLHRTLGNAYLGGYFAKNHGWIARKHDQYMRVIREKGPAASSGWTPCFGDGFLRRYGFLPY